MTSLPVKIFRVLAVLYALVVMTVSSLPNIHIPSLGITWSDKVGHFAQYAVFAFLVAGGWGRRVLNRPWAENWRAAGFLIAFAALDEIHQLWIPRREASFWDWTADSLGIVIGFTVGLFLLHRRRRSATPSP